MTKNIFLSRFSTKKPEPVRQGITIFVISCFFLNPFVFSCGSEVMAAQGVELKDEEMDNVYAEGFTFSFDISMPDTQNIINHVNNAVDSVKAAVKNNFSIIPAGGQSVNTLMVSDYSQQFLSSLVNINAAGSSVPVMLNLSVNVNSKIENIINSNLMNVANYYNYNYNALPAAVQPQTITPAVSAVNPAPEAVINTVQPVLNQPVVIEPAVVAPAVPVVDQVSSQPAVTVNAGNPAVNVPSSADIINNANNIINNVQSNINAAQNDAQTTPQTGAVTPVTTPSVQTTAVGNLGGANTVVIGNNSQQYLSSLVNVNAAGSIVPVLLNLVININSSVNKVSNSNNLDFSTYSRFQLK
ncbi:MAG: hypothetical protein PHN57_04380 [Candidatus Omnitrophica bacterium]|nr:hypothetical protein [Candidatus Omnitrophota bacterium]